MIKFDKISPMNYIVMDLEWNQSSTGKEDVVESLPFEIVEIGAVKLNEDRKMISEFSKIVKPQVYKTMHHITGKLIHLQMQQLESGDPFTEVYTSFSEWFGNEPLFCTWGPLDLIELQRNIRYYNLPALSSGPFAFLDVQKLFSIAFEDAKSRRSLEYAIDYLEISKDIPFHRAFSDAYYTALILERLPENILSRYSFDVFHLPVSKDNEVHVIFDDYSKYISRGFEDKHHALADKEVMSTTCYLCGKPTRKKVKWFTTNNKHYYSVSQCDTHGLMKAKVRLRKAENDLTYVVKTEKFIDPKQAEQLRRKKSVSDSSSRKSMATKNSQKN